MSTALPQQLAARLDGAEEKLAHAQVVVGLDGFVDTILHVVDKRTSADDFSRLDRIAAFGGRISDAAGLSMNFELVPQMVKLGGNGPIMGNAMLAYGTPLTYIGNLGSPAIHPVFADLATRARVISLAEPGYTDAVEFADGKLMLGKLQSLRDVNWQNLLTHLPQDALLNIFSAASLVAIVNWTMLPRMDEILEHILSDVAPGLCGDRRWIFFDLADPAKRTSEDIAGVLKLISGFQRHFDVILGLNFNESRQIGEVLGLPGPKMEPDPVAAHAAAIRANLDIDTVVIHPTAFAGAADRNSSAAVPGPFTAKPMITTGAGDHFNAGFCVGRLLGCDIPLTLQLGVATSGFYVRHAKSPNLADIRQFLGSLQP